MIKMSLVVLTGWFALFAFAGMLATCICLLACESCLVRRTKNKTDDYLVSAAHRAHKYFVWLAVIAIFVHIVLALTA